MNAYICDRCGETFVIGSGAIVQAYRNDHTRSVRRINRQQHVDLCPKCILALDVFINDGKLEKEGLNEDR